MIPATSIAFQDGCTAWLYLPADETDRPHAVAAFKRYDRPCDTCPWDQMSGERAGIPHRCPDCINGRHTFPLDMECEVVNSRQRTTPSGRQVVDWDGSFKLAPVRFRVSVVPGMIAQIVGIGEATTETQYPFITPKVGGGWVLHHIPRAMAERTPITLPSDAKPGGFAALVNWRPA